MDQEQISLKVARAIGRAKYWGNYYQRCYVQEIVGRERLIVSVDHELMSKSVPTYLEVWLWLWREAKWFIKIHPLKDKFHYQILDHHYDEWHSWGVLSMTGYSDPEEAIISAIEYLVDNDLIK